MFEYVQRCIFRNQWNVKYIFYDFQHNNSNNNKKKCTFLLNFAEEVHNKGVTKTVSVLRDSNNFMK